MSLRIDTQFCNYVSSRLTLFKWVRPNLAVCRCPFCGDSETKKSKKRFYFYQRVSSGSLNDGLSAHCHNCAYSAPFGKFLEEFDTSYYSQYRTTNFKERTTTRIVTKRPNQITLSTEKKFEPVVYEKQLQPIPLANRCDTLDSSHLARKYLEHRQVPDLKKFWYSESFKTTAKTFNGLESLENMLDEPRIIIPFYDVAGKLECMQGRSISDKKSGVKYITVKRTEESSKIYGLDSLKRDVEINVVEGPIDSMFLPNCLATADSNLLAVSYGDRYIPDNQFRNKAICFRMLSIIEAGKRIVLLPEEYIEKDINAMVMSGINREDLYELLKTHTYKGLSAKLRFLKLKKC